MGWDDPHQKALSISQAQSSKTSSCHDQIFSLVLAQMAQLQVLGKGLVHVQSLVLVLATKLQQASEAGVHLPGASPVTWQQECQH